MKTLEILKNRRAIASVLWFVALLLSATGTTVNLDVTWLTDAILKLVEAISAIGAIILPIVSLLKPKK